MSFRIIRNDITKVKADAIVNTASPHVRIGSGVDTAIYNAAGRDELFAAREKIGEIERGDAVISPAFNLDAKYIIHAVGTWWNGGPESEIELLKNCYDNTLLLAYKYGCESIAFPLLSTGNYGFPRKLGMEIAVDAFTRFLEEHEMEIILVVFEEDTLKISGELGEAVQSFIDNDYVEARNEDEYGLEREADTPNARKSIKVDLNNSLDNVIQDIYKETFASRLRELIAKKGLKNSEVYAAANIRKQYFSKLLNDQVKPSKEKVLALAVGLKLNINEAEELLQFAGYAFSPISQTDQVVKYFIEHEDYNVLKIDIVLFDYGLDPLSN
ncbi:O-acetyl-ADP-ribose deacetylase (regulator of RNase III), contains Macro domain [Pseudobutyrivibrio sp. C4]|uniref:macro domain-containing protein n=1 Tax=Pseudobutyrivibrio sp. C4 TaxID=1520803 RepID=UPI0008C785BF|nr:macro domain-containing protein [Pseudobutyrivibrio sp. C4]SES65004.1 O-acetyl-ADP-ribose deacetylase (regulator of RNase III), contains Macro domain [Pseudobutyrivibrio sp. C4]